MSAPNDGGPAFPQVTGTPYAFTGMTLRDYFAAKAMHAELNSAGSFEGPALALGQEAAEHERSIEEQIAVNAYLIADAMLAERAKRSAK